MSDRNPDAHTPSDTSTGVASRPWLPITLLTLLAAVLALMGLDFQSLSHDELSTWARTEYKGLKGLLEYGVRTDLHPQGHFLIIWWIKQAGFDSAIAMRLPSALAATASVPLLYRIGTRLFDRPTALLASGLMAVSWCMVFYAQDARAYTLVVLMSLSAIDAAIGLVRTLRGGTWPSAWLWVQFIASGTIAAYLHYYGLFFTGILGLGCLVCLLPRAKQTLAMLAGLSTIGLAYLPWLGSMLEDLARKSAWLPSQGGMFFPKWFAWIFGNATLPAIAAALVLLAGLVYAGMHFKQIRTGSEWKSPLMVALWLLTPGLVAFAKSMVSTPVLTNKNLLMCAPAAYLLVAFSLTRLPIRTIVRNGIGVGLAVLMLVELVMVKGYYNTANKRQYREAVATVVASADNPLVIVCGIEDHFRYYLERAGAKGPALNLCKTKAIPAFQAAIKRNPDRPIAYMWAHYKPKPDVLKYLDTHTVLRDETPLLGAKIQWRKMRTGADVPAPKAAPKSAAKTQAKAAPRGSCGPAHSEPSMWKTWSKSGDPHSLSVREGVIALMADAGPERKTDACLKQRMPLSGDLQISGQWSTELESGTFAQISTRFFSAEGKWVGGKGDERPYKLAATTKQSLDWNPIERTIRLPVDAVSVELCIELRAANGALHLRDLCLSQAAQ